uniref:Uncharacterized protein n=1 Tax=Anopheles melas TaxID=34690 RepID=A0A182U161_9DIPT
MKTPTKRKSSVKVGALFEEYCSESSVHGVRFFVGNQRGACVKLIWVSVFITSLVGCGMMIQQAYNKWDRTPVIVTLSEVPTPVWDMDFPAITICPEIKVLNTNIGKMKAIMHHCSGIYKYEGNFMFNFNQVPEPNLVDFLKDVALDRRGVFTMCSSTSDARCNDYMQVTLTNEGICYSFNMISQAEMFHPDVLQDEYQYLEPWDTDGATVERGELLKVAGSGLDASIGFNLIHYPLKIDTSCVRGRGYRVLIHEPTVYPDLSKRNIRLSLSQTLTVALKPNIMMTSPELSKYSAQKRQCYFGHEHPLRFFRRYNQDNCELECLTNYTLARCGCVHFSMPRTNGTRVCRFEEEHCPYDARGALFIRKQNRTGTDDYLLRCDCLPACSSVRFDLQITQDSHTEEHEVPTRFETLEELQARLQIPVYSVLQVYFQDTHFIPAQRSELHGLVDFLANCGGLLGLFIGQSVKEEVFREYCANSSIHGVRYFDRNERTVCERFFITTIAIYFKESYFITSKRSELYGWVDFLANCGGLLGLFMGGYSQGYKLKIHGIDEYPHMAKRNLRLPLGHEISIALKPQMIVTSPSAADYSWEKRQCFFNHERHLRFFQIYNQENCELECLTNVTRASSVSYDMEMAQTSLDMEKFRLANNELPRDHLDKFTVTTLAIYFKESYFISSKRSELYGWVDFLANCGGLLAITICPETKVPANKLNFTAEMNALLEDYHDNNATSDRESIDQLKAVAQLCNIIFHSDNKLLQYVNGTEDDVVGMLKNLSLSRHGTLGLCQYSNQYMLCAEHLKETLTEEGFCYTFNMMPDDEIFRKSSLHTEYTYTESWLPFSDPVTLAPLYARGAGLHAGLLVYLKQAKEDVDYMCTGYKLMIHDPAEYPQVSMRNMRIPFGHEISIALKPQMMITSQSAADFSWEKRQCFFNNERYLRYFKIYNQDNCELECLTNFLNL